MKFDHLWLGANLVNPVSINELQTLEDYAIGVKEGKITLVCPTSVVPLGLQDSAKQVTQLDMRLVTPGLIDCHTHLVFGGNRAKEFEMRLQGKTYKEIARAGGGIISSVLNTRDASHQELFDSAKKRLLSLMRDGVTTVEIKSGYGLDLETETKMLDVARELGRQLPVTVKKTFLGAHAVPPEYKGRRGSYVDLLCEEILPRLYAEGLVDAVDGFCESIAFDTQEISRIFDCATKLGLPVKLHAEQLSDSGGAKLAASYKALSADHLEYLNEDGVRAMAENGSVAVLLPGAYFMLNETQKPPLDLLRKYRVPVAIATDSNPGTSPVLSARLMMTLACQEFGLTPTESLVGMTYNAAKALGLNDSHGRVEVGKQADMVIWDVEKASELNYWLGGNLVSEVIQNGKLAYQNSSLPLDSV